MINMRKFSFVFWIFCGLLGMASISLAAGGTWIRKADMPTARADSHLCSGWEDLCHWRGSWTFSFHCGSL